MKKPAIFNTLTGGKEEAQVQAAIADSLVPDLMRQKADAEIQAALALSFLTTLGFQTGEDPQVPLSQQIENYIQAKEENEANDTILERKFLETTEAWNKEKAMLVVRLDQEV